VSSQEASDLYDFKESFSFDWATGVFQLDADAIAYPIWQWQAHELSGQSM
jgi:hypothetical protein